MHKSCKNMRLQSSITLFTVAALVCMLFGTTYKLVMSNFGAPTDRTFFTLYGIFSAFSLLLLVIAGFDLIDRMTRAAQYRASLALFIFIGAVFAVMLGQMKVAPSSDAFDCLETGYFLLDHASIPRDFMHIQTVGAFGNNQTLILFFRLLMRPLIALRLDLLSSLYGINALGMFLAILLTWLILRDALGLGAAVKGLLLCALNPVYYCLVCWPYTNTMSLPLMMGLIYVLIRLSRSKKPWHDVCWSLAAGILACIGFEIRATSVFPLVAFAVNGLRQGLRSDNRKAFIRRSACVVLAALLMFLLIGKAKEEPFHEIADMKLPPSFWLKMGSHDNGIFSNDDFRQVRAIESPAERRAVCLQDTLENYRQLGIQGTVYLWYRKLITAWTDGQSHVYDHLTTGERIGPLVTLIAGPSNKIFAIYMHAFRLLLLLGAILACVRRLRQGEAPGIIALLVTTLFGGIVFYLLWEVKAAYSAPFLLVMIGLGQDGLGSLRSTFKNVRIPRHGFRHGAIVYAALTALICAAIASISSYESEMTVSRINSTANTRIQLPIDEGSCRVIRQDFYERNAFNRIVLKADIDPDDAGSCSTYAVTLEDSRRKTLYSAIIDEGCIVDGVVELSMDEIQSDSHYRLSLEKQGDRAPIRFYTRYSLLLDQYRGSLSTDLTDVFPSDLVMDVEYRYTGPYLKPNERLALALLLAAAAGFNLLYLSKKVSPASVHPRAEAGTLP